MCEVFSHLHLITELCENVRVKWTANEEVRKPKVVIDDAVVVKIHGEDNETVPTPARAGSSNQARPRTTQARLEHIE